jgi:GAF domain-containing protein
MSLEQSDIGPIMDKVRWVLKGDKEDKLNMICRILHDDVEHYDWVGFYLVDREVERELVLGPYIGESTEHTNIAFGEGICGQAADTGKLFLIQDVTKETNYLSCSSAVRSEIVLPIFKDDELVGELDIDSHQLEPFNDLDTELLEGICELVAPLL